MWTADVTDWLKQKCLSNWLALNVENLAEDANEDFSVVSYIMKIMFYIRCYPNETPWLWTATPTPWTWANDAKRNFIYSQLHKYMQAWY